jgi:hypothetical protein
MLAPSISHAFFVELARIVRFTSLSAARAFVSVIGELYGIGA